MPEIYDPTDNPLANLNRRVMDTCYHQRTERLISPATISDYIRQRLADNPAQVVKLLIELDDSRALLQCLAPQTNQERTAALEFHNQQDDTPFDLNTDE
jgi:hypothetical protein